MRELERINKSIITADSIETSSGWSLSKEDNPFLCEYCKSPLFYINIEWGIVEDDIYKEIKVLGKEREPQYYLREIGFRLYCAECGHFNEIYYKYFYPEDKVVCSLNDDRLEYVELQEIKHWLDQFNRKGDFTPNYQCHEAEYLKKKLKEHEDKAFK